MSVDDFVGEYEAALATQEWERVAPLIHEACSVIFSDGSLHRGKEAVGAAFRRNFAAIEDEAYAMTDVRWLHRGDDSATYQFEFAWSGVVNGTQADGAGRGTGVIALVDGRWQLLVEHLGPKS